MLRDTIVNLIVTLVLIFVFVHLVSACAYCGGTGLCGQSGLGAYNGYDITGLNPYHALQAPCRPSKPRPLGLDLGFSLRLGGDSSCSSSKCCDRRRLCLDDELSSCERSCSCERPSLIDRVCRRLLLLKDRVKESKSAIRDYLAEKAVSRYSLRSKLSDRKSLDKSKDSGARHPI